jgi:hypothetical protein
MLPRGWFEEGVSEKMKKILQVSFKFNMTRPELEKAFLEGAPAFRPGGNVKGLLWKIWLMNGAERSAGAIYLFKDDASVEAYLKGELFAMLESHPALSDIEAKAFDILPEHTKITRGPVD